MKNKNNIWFISYDNNKWKIKILLDLYFKVIINEN